MACARTSTGTLQCWFRYNYGGTQSVPAEGGFTDIDTNADFACGIDGTGKLVCWGSGAPTTLPTTVQFADIAVDDNGGCGVVSPDGSLICWSGSEPPTGTDYVSVACGGTGCCAVTEDGKLRCWGISSTGFVTCGDTDICACGHWFQGNLTCK